MSKNSIAYTVIAILTLIYLFFFSSKIVVLTNLNPLLFNLISSAVVFCYLDIAYKLYIKKYQLQNKELIFVFASYLIILIYLLFFKNASKVDSSTTDFIPLFFVSPSMIEFTLLVGNIIMFIPIGYFYQKKVNKFSWVFIVALAFLIEGSQFYFKVGVFDLSDVLLYVIGFAAGKFYFAKVEDKSEQYNNLSFDICLVFSLIVILVILLIIINTIAF